jgi:sulfate/thiosulfate transport system permease protein
MTAAPAVIASPRRSRRIGSLKKETVLPGFGLTLGLTLLYLGLVVLMPLSALIMRSAGMGLDGFVEAAFTPRAMASYRLSFGTALVAAAINAVIGLIVAWVLVRYSFPGKRLVDAIVDLPFALPTAVAGLVYASLYGPNGWFGGPLSSLGIDAGNSKLAIVLVLTFTGFPFVVRTVQPVLQDLDPELEEASATLGASRWYTFRRVLLPALVPALLTGFALAFARALGEYGSVIFVSRNIPNDTEIAPILIVHRLEEYAYAEATAIAAVLLAFSFALLLLINLLERRSRRHAG